MSTEPTVVIVGGGYGGVNAEGARPTWSYSLSPRMLPRPRTRRAGRDVTADELRRTFPGP